MMSHPIGYPEIGSAVAAAVYAASKIWQRFNGGSTRGGLTEIKERLAVLEAKVDLLLQSMNLRFRD